MSEKEQFEAWRKDQEENHGLTQIRVYEKNTIISADPALYSHILENEELFYVELNEINKAHEEGRYTCIINL